MNLGRKKCGFGLAVALVWFVLAAPAAAGFLDDGWQHRMKLEFNGYTGSDALVDFPVLVVLDPTKVTYGQFEPGGADLRFATADETTPLDYEIERWGPAQAAPEDKSFVWVRVPSISSTADFIYMYWGKAGAADAQNSGGVWANGFQLVWHLDHAEATDTHPDSTSFARNGTDGGTDTEDLIGPIGGAQDFTSPSDNAPDTIYAPGVKAADLDVNANKPRTIEVWAKPRLFLDAALIEFGSFDTSYYWSGAKELWVLTDRVVNNGGGALYPAPPMGEYYQVANDYRADFKNSVNGYLNKGVEYPGSFHSWVHITVVHEGTTGGNTTMYVDGGFKSKTWSEDLATGEVGTSVDFNIGGQGSWFEGGMYIGSLDEVRVSNVARSAGWVANQYNTMTDNFINTSSADAGGPYSITAMAGATVGLSGSGTPSPGGTSIVDYAWDLNGDGVYTDAAGASPTVTWETIDALDLSPDDIYYDMPPFGPWVLGATPIGLTHKIRLRVTDDAGNVSTGLGWLTLSEDAPFANAGEDTFGFESRGASSYVVLLDGSASFGATSYLWEQTGGMAVTLRNAGTATPDFDAPQWDGSTELTRTQARLQFRLTINAGEATEASDEVEVYIRIPGDATDDDVINAFDLAKVRQSAPEANFNGDSTVNAFDLAILRQNAGRQRTVD